jgi:hypothetical protein
MLAGKAAGRQRVRNGKRGPGEWKVDFSICLELASLHFFL